MGDFNSMSLAEQNERLVERFLARAAECEAAGDTNRAEFFLGHALEAEARWERVAAENAKRGRSGETS